MRDKRWNIERSTPTPPAQNVPALREESVKIGGKSAALGFLCKKQTDPKIVADLQGSGQQTGLQRHRMLMTTLTKFPRALPAGHDLADFTARDQELDAISGYEAALNEHLQDVRLEAHARAVNLRVESDTIADAIVEAARRPGADPEVVAAAAQISRYDEEHRAKVDENRGKVDKAHEEGAQERNQLRAEIQHRDAEILELRRQLSLRAAAEASLPLPGGGGRNIPR
jgi:hypothetical protein